MKNGLIIDKVNNKFYYLNDKLHREDGPAVELLMEKKIYYYYNGKYLYNIKSQEDFERYLKYIEFE